jgi:SAM-dependent methyltransferase
VLVPPRESPRLSWPEDQLEAVERCPICGGRERIRLYDGLQDRVHHCAPGEWTLYQCRACRSAFLDPRPSVAAIGLAYARYYTHETQAAATPQSLLARLRTRLRNGYVRHRFGVPAEPWSRFGVVAAWLLPARRAVVDAEMRHLPRPWAGARLLDVGCGNGAFLDRARRAGWDAMGVDPDPVAVQAARCRGLNVQRGGIECLDAGTPPFDVITLNHVIEHVHDPVALLRGCRSLLRPGGRLWLQTPNLEAQGHRLYGRHWRHLDPPRHLVLFTPTSLRRALGQAGFEQVVDLPWRPLCHWVFAASEALARGEPRPSRALSLAWRRRVARAERVARRDPSVREFIAVIARNTP